VSPAGLFVIGTDTEVGKTVVAAVIARTAAARGIRVRVFKPAVSGLAEPGEADHELLRRAAGSPQSDEQVAPYRYQPPLAPQLAAALVGEEIDPARLRAAAAFAAADAELVVCEGVGGLLVPLAADYLVRDLARELGYPIVAVAGPGLGTINHTLLTIESLRAAGLELARVVLTPWPADPGPLERYNRETIARLGAIEVTTLPRVALDRPEEWPQLGPF
jgi:dethiobiotin synthetase